MSDLEEEPSALTVFGAAESGQIPTGAAEQQAALSHPLRSPCVAPGMRIAALSLGSGHGVWLTADGQLFSFGINDSGQCGIPSAPLVNTPTRIESLETISIL